MNNVDEGVGLGLDTGNDIGSTIVFFLLAIWILAGALFAIQLKRVVHVVLAIASTMVGIAALYFFLNAMFVAVAQLLIYAGAVSVLMLFGIMLTRHEVEEDGDFVPHPRSFFYSHVLLFLVMILLIERGNSGELPGAGREASLMSIGTLIFRDYSLPLEALSILLLVAVVGAVALTRPKEG